MSVEEFLWRYRRTAAWWAGIGYVAWWWWVAGIVR